MSSGGEDDMLDRQRTMSELERMISDLPEDDDEDRQQSGDAGLQHTELQSAFVEDEGDEGEFLYENDDDDDDDDEEFDPDYDDVEDEDEDEEYYIEMDEVMDEVEEDEDEASHIIDFSTLLQMAAGRSNDDDEEAEDIQAPRAARALRGIGLEGLRRLLRSGRVQIRRAGADDDDDDDEEEEDGGPLTFFNGSASRRGGTSRMSEFWDPITEPIAAGKELLLGGDFRRPVARPVDAPRSNFEMSRNLVNKLSDRKLALRRIDKSQLSSLVPNTNGTEVARYPARCYCGQYSEDSSFFYTCTQDFRVHMYDTTANPYKKVHKSEDAPYATRMRYYHTSSTTHLTSLRSIKTIQGRHGSWTITDANLSPDNRWMIYSSITPYVHLVPTRKEIETGGQRYSDDQVMLDFSNQGHDDAGIWSIRFSGDSREIVAGAHFGDIYVYDIEARRRVMKVEGHSDDVNGVAFADSASSNVLISGSDDSFVKVWDRRSLSGGKPAGVFLGHTEGITYVSPKGDGRYCISNGKDQSLKLWDLRKLVSSQEFDRLPSRDYGLRQWDYRNMTYRRPRYASHPNDCSVMTYRGHAVLRTLIRCHFSPIATTGQKYVYSGSADGRIHIWSLDGQVVQVLDRSKVIPLCEPGSLDAADPSAAIRSEQSASEGDLQRPDSSGTRTSRQAHSYIWNAGPSEVSTVRDVSWHSSEPALMSTAWDGPDGQSGSIAKHEWKGFGKNGLSLEDAIEKSIAEANR